MSLAIAVILTGLAQAQSTIDDAAKPTSCGVSIKACGCTISSPGFYDVAGTLLDVKLNSDTSCVAIKSPNVVLSLDGMTISGAGAGIGIHVLSGANNSFVSGSKAGGGSNAMVTGWDTGILVEANNVVVQNVTTGSNATTGIQVHKAKFVSVSGVTSSSNKNGVWLNDSSLDQVDYSPGISGNKGPGILIGCTGTCPKSATSSQNRILGNTLSKNQSGIVIVSGSLHNVITDNSATGSTGGDDMMDSNNDCATDIWFGNMFGTAEPAPCIN